MPVSPLRFIKNCSERLSKEEVSKVPVDTRGIYALLCQDKREQTRFDVVYIGMARGNLGVAGRLRSHKRSKSKSNLWTHFSVYEVWDNITDEEIQELEGLFRHIYRRDGNANAINKQRSFRKLSQLRNNNPKEWKR